MEKRYVLFGILILIAGTFIYFSFLKPREHSKKSIVEFKKENEIVSQDIVYHKKSLNKNKELKNLENVIENILKNSSREIMITLESINITKGSFINHTIVNKAGISTDLKYNTTINNDLIFLENYLGSLYVGKYCESYEPECFVIIAKNKTYLIDQIKLAKQEEEAEKCRFNNKCKLD